MQKYSTYQILQILPTSVPMYAHMGNPDSIKLEPHYYINAVACLALVSTNGETEIVSMVFSGGRIVPVAKLEDVLEINSYSTVQDYLVKRRRVELNKRKLDSEKEEAQREARKAKRLSTKTAKLAKAQTAVETEIAQRAPEEIKRTAD